VAEGDANTWFEIRGSRPQAQGGRDSMRATRLFYVYGNTPDTAYEKASPPLPVKGDPLPKADFGVQDYGLSLGVQMRGWEAAPVPGREETDSLVTLHYASGVNWKIEASGNKTVLWQVKIGSLRVEQWFSVDDNGEPQSVISNGPVMIPRPLTILTATMPGCTFLPYTSETFVGRTNKETFRRWAPGFVRYDGADTDLVRGSDIASVPAAGQLTHAANVVYTFSVNPLGWAHRRPKIDPATGLPSLTDGWEEHQVLPRVDFQALWPPGWDPGTITGRSIRRGRGQS
jgi:hypothetical protein